MRDLTSCRMLSFDCYGTLVDWENGILAALRPLLHGAGYEMPDRAILEHYARFEPAAEVGPFRPYRAVLRSVVDAFANELGFTVTEEERRSLERSLADWEPFPDTVQALQALESRFHLAVFSNVDDDLFAATAAKLGVEFDAVITAQQVGAYKPAAAFFDHALRSIDVEPEALLHVAQSLYHDVAPARARGISTVWVNRRHGNEGFGATAPSDARPDLEVPDLASLVARLIP